MTEAKNRVIDLVCPNCKAPAGTKCFEVLFGVFEHTFHNARIDAYAKLPRPESEESWQAAAAMHNPKDREIVREVRTDYFLQTKCVEGWRFCGMITDGTVHSHTFDENHARSQVELASKPYGSVVRVVKRTISEVNEVIYESHV